MDRRRFTAVPLLKILSEKCGVFRAQCEKDETKQQSCGTAYEQIAGRFLEKKGFQILEYNYRCRAGEIDLIARDREYLVFCEVKYRRTKSAGSALEAVDTKKQKRLYRCAQQYVAAHKIPDAAARFDVVAIEGDEVCHIENAFEGA